MSKRVSDVWGVARAIQELVEEGIVVCAEKSNRRGLNVGIKSHEYYWSIRSSFHSGLESADLITPQQIGVLRVSNLEAYFLLK